MEVNNGHATKKHRDIGITNPYYTDTAIKKDLKDDIAKIKEVPSAIYIPVWIDLKWELLNPGGMK